MKKIIYIHIFKKMQMRYTIFKIIILTLFIVQLGNAQEYKSPKEGKSLVYFVRPSGLGALINFKYFDGEQYLGKFNGSNYIIYECNPGEHLFWASAENREFVEADLRENSVYIIEARPMMGAIKARISLIPIEVDNVKAMKKINRLLSRKEAKKMDSTTLERDSKKFEYYIKNGLKRHQELTNSNKKIKQLRAEMHHN